MDLSVIARDVSEEVFSLLKKILKLKISPQEKIKQIKKVLLGVGAPFSEKTYADLAYLLGAENMKSAVKISNDAQEKFAYEILRTAAIGREIAPMVVAHFENLQGEQAAEAFKNANSLAKHPTVTRYCSGAKNCAWCIDHQVNGATYPSSEHFARHNNCDCVIRVSGYRSRNGEVKNYHKKGGKK